MNLPAHRIILIASFWNKAMQDYEQMIRCHEDCEACELDLPYD